MENEPGCKCIKIIGHLEAVKWFTSPRRYKPSAGPLALGDWKQNPYIWLYYVESSDGILLEHDVLRSTNARYWCIHDVQRYFLGELHCEQVLFTYQYPSLKLPSRLATYLWKANASLKLPPKLYMKELHMSIEDTLKKMEMKQAQMNRLLISDQLIKIDRLDYFKRKTFFRILQNIISFQDKLQLVSFENLGCKRLEGVRLIQQLACFASHTLKYLFLWRFVLPNENPLLINYSYITGSGQHIPRPPTRQCFLRSLGELRELRILALEYAHIADGTGNALLSLLPVIRRPHFQLQLICRENQSPGKADARLGVGGYDIPDTAWRRVTTSCPDLYLFMAFFRIRDYDNVRRFITPSVPLREAHLQLGVDLTVTQRQDSDLSCFMRTLAYYNSDSLVTLSIHQWRSVELPIRRVLELMPRLTRLMYIGRCCERDLREAFKIVACGVCESNWSMKIDVLAIAIDFILPVLLQYKALKLYKSILYRPNIFKEQARPWWIRTKESGDLRYCDEMLLVLAILIECRNKTVQKSESFQNCTLSKYRNLQTYENLREVFEYYGNNRTVKDYFILCAELKQIDIQIQDEDSKRIYWSRTVEVLTEQYKDIMQLFDIKFSLEIYKC